MIPSDAFSRAVRRVEDITAALGLRSRPPSDMRFEDAVARAAAPASPHQIAGFVKRSAEQWHVDPALVQAIIAIESGFDSRATSPTGAAGLMQLEPATAAGLGVGNPYDPAQNIWGGTRYIRGLLDRFHGNLRLAVAAYNAGPNAVERYGGIPPYAETNAYVRKVLDAYQTYKVHW